MALNLNIKPFLNLNIKPFILKIIITIIIFTLSGTIITTALRNNQYESNNRPILKSHLDPRVTEGNIKVYFPVENVTIAVGNASWQLREVGILWRQHDRKERIWGKGVKEEEQPTNAGRKKNWWQRELLHPGTNPWLSQVKRFHFLIFFSSTT